MGTFFVLGCLPALSSTLTTPRTRKTRDVSCVFRVRRHPCPLLPFPCSPTRRRAHVGTFFVLGCLPPPHEHEDVSIGTHFRARRPPHHLLELNPTRPLAGRVFRFWLFSS